MGQSAKSRTLTQKPEISRLPAGDIFEVSFFVTELGWFGVWGVDGKVASLRFGHATRDEVRRADDCLATSGIASSAWEECDWNPELRRRLERFAAGSNVDFSDVEIVLPAQTPFQKKVIATVRRVKYGETNSYGKLAARAGYPRAARAVGSVMASNRIPIIVPCHRVVASGGRLGGYSSPRGVELKQHLLAMEAAAGCDAATR